MCATWLTNSAWIQIAIANEVALNRTTRAATYEIQ